MWLHLLMSFLCGISYVFHLWNLSSSSYPNDFVCVRVWLCVHTCMSRSLFWLCLILCFVTGHVPQSGETAHKRVCDFLLCVSVKKWTKTVSHSVQEKMQSCVNTRYSFPQRAHTRCWLVALNFSCSVHFFSKSLQFSSHCLPHLKETPSKQALLALSAETVKNLHLQQL